MFVFGVWLGWRLVELGLVAGWWVGLHMVVIFGLRVLDFVGWVALRVGLYSMRFGFCLIVGLDFVVVAGGWFCVYWLCSLLFTWQLVICLCQLW